MKNKIWLLLYLFCSFFVANGQTVTSLKKNPIIDMHLHAVWWGEPLLIGPLGLKAPKDPAAMRDSTFYYLKKFNIVRAVTDDAFALDYFRQDPQRIIPARQGISPFLRDSVDSLRHWFSAGTYKLMAEFMPQYIGLRPDDPEMEPYFQVADELNIPVGIHLGIGKAAFPDFRIANANPLYLENVMRKHPNLRLYVMHAGYPFLSEMIALMNTYPQVYVDIAVINWMLPKKEFHFYLQRLVDAGFGSRIMYGSDEMMWPQSMSIAIENINSAPFLSEQQKQDIFYNNAAKFLQLSQEDIKRDKGF